jgi:phosphate transport system permease protein
MSELIEVVPPKRKLKVKASSTSDRVFYGISTAAAYSTIFLVVAILFFLSVRAWPTFERFGVINFVFGSGWDNTLENPSFAIGPMLYGSFLIAGIGVLFAVPMAISIAYFIEFMAAKPIAKATAFLVDLLAAIPSVVIGIWGLTIFSSVGAHWGEMLHNALGFLPMFENDAGNFLRTPFIAGIIVSVMIVPIIASITREIFSQIDKDLISASLALGGNRESTFRKVILPTASGGIIGGVLLALGRALGETVAIFFVLNLVFNEVNWFRIVLPEGGAIASLILAKFADATADEISALLAAGVVLFVFTLIINSIASYIVVKAQPWRK